MDLDKIRCKDCKYWKKIYVHPLSTLPTEFKGFNKGFACTLPDDKEFIDSFGGDNPEAFIEVMIGKLDSVGCENFTEVSK